MLSLSFFWKSKNRNEYSFLPASCSYLAWWLPVNRRRHRRAGEMNTSIFFFTFLNILFPVGHESGLKILKINERERERESRSEFIVSKILRRKRESTTSYLLLNFGFQFDSASA